ncbi:MAG: carboxylating nicotinate-nucleotide diphosphorylase [Planctomycetota bacterium]
MPNDFPSVVWDDRLTASARALVRLAKEEDLSSGVDLTTAATVDSDRRGVATLVAREAGVIAGLAIGPLVLEEFGADAAWAPVVDDGAVVQPGSPIAEMRGRAADLLTCERTVLNFVGRLSGIATLTGEFVRRVAGTGAAVYDTRKTAPGWRLLEKHAVRCGGGCNHRLGLSEAVLIKDNHLALSDEAGLTAADAVRRARRYVASLGEEEGARDVVVQVEVDTLEQLASVLPASPDIVLLDNMSPETLRRAVAIRDSGGHSEGEASVVLEASGGVNLDTIVSIAQAGVDRVSIGALTHSAPNFDIGLDWGPFHEG